MLLCQRPQNTYAIHSISLGRVSCGIREANEAALGGCLGAFSDWAAESPIHLARTQAPSGPGRQGESRLARRQRSPLSLDPKVFFLKK